MAEKENFRLKQLHGRLGDLMIQLTKVNFSQTPAPGTWTPAVNAFRCEQGYAVCVELAGVKKDGVEIQVQNRTIQLRGRREIPEPRAKGEEAKQILAMEIDSGPFAREITLPTDIEVEAVRAEHLDGFIWIFLPHRSDS
jgi:HSP20 family protein